jgi:hypothetical protein
VTSVVVCESCLDFNARIIFHNLFVLLNFPFASPDLGEPIFGLSCVRCLPLDRLLVYLLACLPVHKPTGVGKILVCFSISADLFLLLKSPAIFLVHASATIGLRSSFVLIFCSAPMLVLAFIDSCISVLLPLDSVFVPAVTLQLWSCSLKIFLPRARSTDRISFLRQVSLPDGIAGPCLGL